MKQTGYILLIAGSRRLDNYKVFSEGMQKVTDRWGIPSKIISGGAPGTESLAVEWSLYSRIPMQGFPSDLKKKGAVRDERMIRLADKIVAFVDDQSIGTWDTIERVREYKGKELIVFKVEEVKNAQ